jgi:uncharacterized protein DUF1064
MSGTEVLKPWQLRRELGQPPLPGDPPWYPAGSGSSTPYVRKQEPREGGKYGVAPVEERTAEGVTFASAGEMRRYLDLRLLEHGRAISGLERQPVYDLVVNGQLICRYVGDFRYIENGQVVVEDWKSKPTRTPIYRVKRKLMLACHGIEIRETGREVR